MALHRRGGRNASGRRKRPKQRRRSTSTSDDNSSDGGSTTRCVCGETHSVGLMVQCDNCEVWQHCSCMGLEQPDIPDQYYCEQCKPENHKTMRLNNGRTRRQYVDSDRTKAPKKRMTLNSREASMSLEDVLAARNALEMYEAHKDGEEEIEEELPNKQMREVELKLPDTIEEKSEPPSSTVSSVGHEETSISVKEQVVEEQEEKATPKQKKRLIKSSMDEPAKKKRGNKPTKRGKPRSRPSTPMRESSPMTPHSDMEDDQKDSPQATHIFDYFTPEARASSPPAKVRYPIHRMTIAEMNRRANQILEYISSIQVEMATKGNINSSSYHAGQVTNDDDNDSLSSASTIPLDREDEDEDNDLEAKTAFELMDRLTRKLIKFQKRFACHDRSLFQDEAEGRITRSNGNVNSFRNF